MSTVRGFVSVARAVALRQTWTRVGARCQFVPSAVTGKPWTLWTTTVPARLFHENSVPPLKKETFVDVWGKKGLGGVSEQDQRAIQAAFDLIDLDENGVIDREEQSALEVVLSDANFNPQDVKRAIQEMDLDGNGEISREEFVKWWISKELPSRSKKIRDAVREYYSGDGVGDDKLD